MLVSPLCDTSGIGAGGVWLNPSGSGTSLVWRHPWLPDIIKALITDRNPEGTLTNSDPIPPPSSSKRLPCWKRAQRQQWPRPNRDWITRLPFPGAPGRHLPSTRWLRTSSTSARSTLISFFSTLRSSTTQAWKIAWRMTHLAYLIFRTHHFLPTCPSPICSRTFWGNSAPCCRNCFHA